MADVFVAHTRQDKEFVDKLSAELQKKNHSSAVEWDDSCFDPKVWKQIELAIRQSEAFAFVVSTETARSDFLKQEITFAQQLEKPIIELLTTSVDLMDLPLNGSLQDCIDFRQAAEFGTAVDRLVADLDGLMLEHLQQKAATWEAQGRQDCDLLPAAAEWQERLETCLGQYPALQEYLSQSLAAEETNKDVFISYSHKDKEFVKTIYEALKQSHNKSWVDWRDIPGGTKWEECIYPAIWETDLFLLLHSHGRWNTFL
jgi:hypothetical protein